MHFDLTEDQKALRDVLVSMFEKRFGGAQGVEAVADTALDRELWAEVSELGLAGILVAEEHGGLGMGLLTLSVVAEVLGTLRCPHPSLPMPSRPGRSAPPAATRCAKSGLAACLAET